MASILSSANPRWLSDSSSHSPFGDQNLSVWQATAYNRSYYDSTEWISDPFDYYSVVKMNDSFSMVARNRTADEFPEYRLAKRLWLWIAPLLLIIGTLGNVLSFFTLRSCTFRKCSIAFTLSALAVVDTSVLYTALLRQWILNMPWNYDIRVLLGSFGCKLHMFLTYYLLHLSSWTLVVVTVERAVCISMPFMARAACTKTRIVGSWVLVAAILAIINSHLLWIAEYDEFKLLQRDNTTIARKICFAGIRYRTFFYNLWYWLDFIILSTIPFVFIIVGNIVITCCVFRAMEFRRQQAIPITPSSPPPFSQSSTLSTPSQTEPYKPLTSSTTMLIGISVLFLLTTTPSAIYFVLSDDMIGVGPHPEGEARLTLIFAVTNLLQYTNNSLNFLLYCLTGSRFRRAFVDHFRRESGVVSTARRMSRGVITIGTRSSNCNGNIGIQLHPTTTEDRNMH